MIRHDCSSRTIKKIKRVDVEVHAWNAIRFSCLFLDDFGKFCTCCSPESIVNQVQVLQLRQSFHGLPK